LVYSGGSAPFSFDTTIDAGLHDYSFELLLEISGQLRQIGFVGQVVCGDAFLINGQSNAVAGDYWGEGRGNDSQSRWIRSYGSASLDPSQVISDTEWHLADGISLYESGTVGAWGLRAARLLVDYYQVPIALINGAVGGTPLILHLRNNGNPDSLSTIYGRLLYRARQAGVDQSVRAMLWHQGESDGPTDPAIYYADWSDLRDAWLQDFPSLEQIFMFQVRDGCGVNGNMGIREAQRRFKDLFSDVTVLPTTAISSHDGCHFLYSGYRKMGTWMGVAIAKVLYGRSIPEMASPPNIHKAQFTSAARDEIELIFRNPNQLLFFPPDIKYYFRLSPGSTEAVVSATASAGKIILQLSGSTSSPEVSYFGHIQAGPWITNSAGVGAFTFQVPILP
jgi:hypothetical protein